MEYVMSFRLVWVISYQLLMYWEKNELFFIPNTQFQIKFKYRLNYMIVFAGMKVMKVMIQRKRSSKINSQVCNIPLLHYSFCKYLFKLS